MELIKDATNFYKGKYLMIILDITYNYINYFLCLIYLCWYSYIISNTSINNNYINYYLIFYSFYKINSFFKQNKYIINDIIISIIYIGFFYLDLINNNTIYNIQYWICYNLLINAFIFIYGTLYLIIKSDTIINYESDNDTDNEFIY